MIFSKVQVCVKKFQIIAYFYFSLLLIIPSNFLDIRIAADQDSFVEFDHSVIDLSFAHMGTNLGLDDTSGSAAVVFQHAPGKKAPIAVEKPVSVLQDGDYHIYLPLIIYDKQLITFPDENQVAHHTELWPNYVFRRVQWLDVQVELPRSFETGTDQLTWSVRGPLEEFYKPIEVDSSSLDDTNWAVREGAYVNGYRMDKIFIPAETPLGKFSLKATFYKDSGTELIESESETSPDFFVIFNPWNDDSDPRFDTHVYNPGFSADELYWYTLNAKDVNYYGVENGSLTTVWDLDMYSEVVFLPVMEEVQGISSASEAMTKLVDKARWDHETDIPQDDSDIIDGQWIGDIDWNWKNVPEIMAFWDYGSAHPTGQCMDFGGLVTAFAKAIGVPSRMLTLVCEDCGFDFHVWNEVWINDVNSLVWSAADGMENIGPVNRQDPHFQWYVTRGSHLYTYDAITGTRVDIIDEY